MEKKNTQKKVLTEPKKDPVYEPFNGNSFTEALDSIGEDSSFENRAKIAQANGLMHYYAWPDQDVKLLKLAKQGLLKKH